MTGISACGWTCWLPLGAQPTFKDTSHVCWWDTALLCPLAAFIPACVLLLQLPNITDEWSQAAGKTSLWKQITHIVFLCTWAGFRSSSSKWLQNADQQGPLHPYPLHHLEAPVRSIIWTTVQCTKAKNIETREGVDLHTYNSKTYRHSL